MAVNRSDKSRILRRYFPGMTRNSEMSTEPSDSLVLQPQMAAWSLGGLEKCNVQLRPPCGISMKLSYI